MRAYIVGVCVRARIVTKNISILKFYIRTPKKSIALGPPQAMQSSRFLAVLTVAAVVNSLDVDVEQ